MDLNLEPSMCDITHTDLVPYIFPENSAHSIKLPAPMLFFISSRVVKWYSTERMEHTTMNISPNRQP